MNTEQSTSRKERTNFVQWIVVAMFSAVSGSIAGGAIATVLVQENLARPRASISAQSFHLVSADGMYKSAWSFSKDGQPGICFLNNNGEIAAHMSILPENGAILSLGRDEVADLPRLSIAAMPDDFPEWTQKGSYGPSSNPLPQVLLAAFESGASDLIMNDRLNKAGVQIGKESGSWRMSIGGLDAARSVQLLTSEDGLSILHLTASDADGRESGAVLSASKDASGLIIMDMEMKPVVELLNGPSSGSRVLLMRDPGPDEGSGPIRASMMVGPESAAISIADKEGTTRAQVGGVTLVAEKTQVEEKRPESSMTLFDKEGKVQWSVP